MAFNECDYIIIAILALSLLAGYARGFAGALGGIIATLVSMGIAFWYRNVATVYLEEQYGVVSVLTTYLEKRLQLPGASGSLPDIISSLPLIDNGYQYLHNQITGLSYMLVAGVCFLILFMAAYFLLQILGSILERVLARGIVGSINRWGGMILITGQNILIMAVLAGILQTPAKMAAEMGLKNAGRLQGYLDGSQLFTLLGQIFIHMQAIVGLGA